jgi:hypothetical protein
MLAENDTILQRAVLINANFSGSFSQLNFFFFSSFSKIKNNNKNNKNLIPD